MDGAASGEADNVTLKLQRVQLATERTLLSPQQHARSGRAPSNATAAAPAADVQPAAPPSAAPPPSAAKAAPSRSAPPPGNLPAPPPSATKAAPLRSALPPGNLPPPWAAFADDRAVFDEHSTAAGGDAPGASSANASADVPGRTRVRLLALDVETAGPTSSDLSVRLTEVALVDVSSGRVLLDTLVHPGHAGVDCALTGISDNMLLGAPPTGEVLAMLVRAVEDACAVSGSRSASTGVGARAETPALVAHNGFGFDFKVLLREARRTGVALPGSWLCVDTLPLARALLVRGGSAGAGASAGGGTAAGAAAAGKAAGAATVEAASAAAAAGAAAGRQPCSLEALRERFKLPKPAEAHRSGCGTHARMVVQAGTFRT